MESNADIILGLRAKISQLIDLYENKQKECSLLEDKVRELEASIKKKDNDSEFVKQENKKLILATAFKSGSKDAIEAKRNINKLVKEIDRCIALLNN